MDEQWAGIPMATRSYPHETVALWDWRRRITELYARVRASEPHVAWQLWREVRDDLFRNHPQTPIDPSRRTSFSGLSYFEYDPSLRMLIDLVSKKGSEPTTIDLDRDGLMSLTPFARTKRPETEVRWRTDNVLDWRVWRWPFFTL